MLNFGQDKSKIPCVERGKARISAAGIPLQRDRIFRGLKFEPDAEIGQKGAFCKGLVPGFTLIELLVVMFIAVLSLSVVAPRLFGAYEKIGRSAEERKLADIVEAASLKSFFRQAGYTLALEGHTLDLKGLETIITFEYITFPPQAIDFNGNGFSDTEKIIYNAGEKEKILPLECHGISTPG